VLPVVAGAVVVAGSVVSVGEAIICARLFVLVAGLNGQIESRCVLDTGLIRLA